MNSITFLSLPQLCYTGLVLLTDGAIKGTFIFGIIFAIKRLTKHLSANRQHLLSMIVLGSFLLLPVFLLSQHFDDPALSLNTQKLFLPVNEIQIYEIHRFQALRNPEYQLPASGTSLPKPFLSLFLIWFSGFMYGWIKIVLGKIGAYGIQMRSKPVSDDSIITLLQRIKKDLHVHCSVKLCISESALSPITHGIFKPVIIVPVEALNWSEARWTIVLLHELFHVQRLDNISQFILTLVAAIYWFHPLVWLLKKELRYEQETACDDLVVSSGIKSHIYAEQLLQFARSFKSPRFFPGTVGLIEHPSIYEKRIINILNPKKDRRIINLQTILAGLFLMLCIIILFSTVNISTAKENFTLKNPLISYNRDRSLNISLIDPVIKIRNASIEYLPSIWPIADSKGRIARKFGYHSNLFFNKTALNSGIDIDVGDQSLKVLATAVGEVLNVGRDSEYGNYIIIRHMYGLNTLYSNISKLAVTPGHIVYPGSIIAYTGNNRFFHYEIRTGNIPIDPLPFTVLFQRYRL